jgi:hypothetical protein
MDSKKKVQLDNPKKHDTAVDLQELLKHKLHQLQPVVSSEPQRASDLTNSKIE